MVNRTKRITIVCMIIFFGVFYNISQSSAQSPLGGFLKGYQEAQRIKLERQKVAIEQQQLEESIRLERESLRLQKAKFDLEAANNARLISEEASRIAYRKLLDEIYFRQFLPNQLPLLTSGMSQLLPSIPKIQEGKPLFSDNSSLKDPLGLAVRSMMPPEPKSITIISRVPKSASIKTSIKKKK